MRRVLGIIPARAGSKRLPNKNLRVLGDKPLVVWAIDAALAAKKLTHVVVSSDSPEILRIAEQRGALPLQRPAELSSDTSPAIDYVTHAVTSLHGPLRGELTYDAVVIVQPTSPFTHSDDIDGTIQLLTQSGADSAVSVVKLEHGLHPAKLKTMVGDRLLPYCEDEGDRFATHELPEIFVRNGSVYATRLATIQAGRVIGNDCRGYVMPRERSVDINDHMDLIFARFLLSQQNSENNH